MIKVTFLPGEKTVTAAPGTGLFQAAVQAGVPLESTCGGKGTCGKCQVKLVEGKRNKPSTAELKYLSTGQLAAGWVLACQRKVLQDITVEVFSQKDAPQRKTALKGKELTVEPEPALAKIPVKLEQPTLENQTPDLERLLARLPRADLEISRRELAGLPRNLREALFSVTAVLAGNRLVAVEPGDTTAEMYGLALDIGTTTIMGSLLNLHSGSVLAVDAATNPQNAYGADVISRINHASSDGGLAQLQQKVTGAVNDIVRNLLGRTGVDRNRVYEAVAVGNTTMSHLFLGVDPTYLAPAPFIPAYRRAVEVKAAELGLAMHPDGRVLVLPNLAGYVGSDTVGVILATGLDRAEDTCLAIDIGTNGELLLAVRGRLLACSTAAGPAFEGARIRHGMRAADGAIEAVRIAGDVELAVIGKTAPRGICGSGLLDAAAELFKAGLVEISGRFVDPESGGGPPEQLKGRLRRGEGGLLEFVLAHRQDSATGEDIVLTQGDLRELQLAKGAIYAGFKILLKEAGVTPAEVDRILLAGAFGNYIRTESALAIGLLPGLPAERIIPVGNAAGDGARLALLSKPVRERAASLPGRVEHVELSTRPDFQQEFIDALSFPSRAAP